MFSTTILVSPRGLALLVLPEALELASGIVFGFHPLVREIILLGATPSVVSRSS